MVYLVLACSVESAVSQGESGATGTPKTDDCGVTTTKEELEQVLVGSWAGACNGYYAEFPTEDLTVEFWADAGFRVQQPGSDSLNLDPVDTGTAWRVVNPHLVQVQGLAGSTERNASLVGVHVTEACILTFHTDSSQILGRASDGGVCTLSRID